MNPKLALVCLALATLSLPSKAGVFSDDPIEISARPLPHAFTKDEIKFELTGKCHAFLINNPEVEIELTYPTGKTTVNASQQWWFLGKPITVKLPDDYSKLQSFHLKGKFAFVLRWKPHPKNPHPPPYASTDDMNDNLETVHGYKLDSSWTTK